MEKTAKKSRKKTAQKQKATLKKTAKNKKNRAEKITENSTLKQILEIQGAEKVLQKHNLPCLSCPMASFEMDALKIKDAAQMYGLDLKKIIKDLNNL